MDDLRFRAQQSPRGEGPGAASMNAFVSPPRNGNRLSGPPAIDPRSSLPRRFTTESGRVPTLSTLSLAGQRGQEPQDLSATQTNYKVQLLEKKRAEYEALKAQKRRFETEMQKLDYQQRREEQEMAMMTEDIRTMAGHQSEPTTPPEYHETSGFPNMFSKPNRYSMSSLTSPLGLYGRPGRSGSQLASPQSGLMQARMGFDVDDQLPTRSVPASRRNSDEDEKEEAVRQDPTSHRSTNALNRYSMPVTRSRTGGFYDLNLDQNNTAAFLFGDEDGTNDLKQYQASMAAPGDDFPTLVTTSSNILSASSAALDLAQSQTPVPEGKTNGWNSASRHHRAQHSMSGIPSSQLNGGGPTTPGQSSSARNSMDLKYYADTTDATAAALSPSANPVLTSPPKLQSSFSTNDIPTVKNMSGGGFAGNTNFHAQQHLQQHNASLGRVPPNAVPNRHTRELSNENNALATREPAGYASIGSTLQASAAPFGPTTPLALAQAQPAVSTVPTPVTPAHANPYGGYYNNMTPNSYGMGHAAAPSPYTPNMQMLAQGMQGMSMNGMNGTNGAGAMTASGSMNSMNSMSPMSPMSPMGGSNGSMYSNQNYTGYNPIYGNSVNQPTQRDSQARVIQSRRQMDNEAMVRFHNLPLESVVGTIYELCKDQHGCRYLQKQLEGRHPNHIHMIWLETNIHVVELMTDPFGNYLCQKLLEYCNDDERTVLVQNAASDMVRIALNQHGTRALQKMIEFLNTEIQINIVIEALRHRVVELIKDLNGNHVIQKCLNKLSAADSQFIFDAVGDACVEVGTHRHGCCVLQRCIDHASGQQKFWLIDRIKDNAVRLVQDPFGNYVVQYIIDLQEVAFTEPLVAVFRGQICRLSRHKFSSNVIEKLLRCSLEPSKDLIASEMLVPGEMEQLLRDGFANYVIQTALEYCSAETKERLVDAIRPIMPSIRSTPHGRRIQGKIASFETRSGPGSGTITPSDATAGQIPLRPQQNRAANHNPSILSGGFHNGLNGGGPRAIEPQYPASHSVAMTASTAPIMGQIGAQYPQALQYSAPPALNPSQYMQQVQGGGLNGSPGAPGAGNGSLGYGAPAPAAQTNGSPNGNNNAYKPAGAVGTSAAAAPPVQAPANAAINTGNAGTQSHLGSAALNGGGNGDNNPAWL